MARKNYYPDQYNGDLYLIKSEKYNFKDVNLGWKGYVIRAIDSSSIPCDHHSIVIEPFVVSVTKVYERLYLKMLHKKGLLDNNLTALNIKIAK